MLRIKQQIPAFTRAVGLSKCISTKSGTWLEGDLNLDTKVVHSAVTPEPKTGAILTPLFLSTTFIQESVEKYLEKGYSYSRTNNPTVTALEQKLAECENGYGSSAFGTGMAATTAPSRQQ